MLQDPSGRRSALIQEVETRVRQTTHDRIRGLAVEDVQGQVVVRGQAPSYHAKQLALHAVFELLSSDRCRTNITVG